MPKQQTPNPEPRLVEREHNSREITYAGVKFATAHSAMAAAVITDAMNYCITNGLMSHLGSSVLTDPD